MQNLLPDDSGYGFDITAIVIREKLRSARIGRAPGWLTQHIFRNHSLRRMTHRGYFPASADGVFIFSTD